MRPEHALKIARDFMNFIKTGNRELIFKYSKEELQAALDVISPHDKHRRWYKAMEKRIRVLEREEGGAKRQKKEKDERRELAVGFFLGIIIGLIGMLIVAWIIYAVF
ncbi:MAG: hypothetical protein JSW40_03525 [Candidatus Omnitrophota bacterium]|nr:MAG: hypothetical protein JSW40_03525 [Candidatus Omnitrophota bacterium]